MAAPWFFFEITHNTKLSLIVQFNTKWILKIPIWFCQTFFSVFDKNITTARNNENAHNKWSCIPIRKTPVSNKSIMISRLYEVRMAQYYLLYKY